MPGNGKKTLTTILLTFVGALVVSVAGAIIVAYSGAVNVAAMTPSSGLTRWFLITTRRHSISSRASSIKVPKLDDPAMVEVGVDHYKEMCVGCHGAPGVEQNEADQGLEPPAPKLYKAPPMTDQRAARTFWIIKNGIRMTGMPAIGKTHDDKKIWAIVAFLKKVRTMSPADYKKVAGSAGHDEGDRD